MKKFLCKNRFFVITLLVFIILSSAFSGIVYQCVNRFNGITIVLDAGHGGRDGGSVGINGSIEKELNLAYTISLKDKLVKSGYKVVLTRKNDDGLYSNLAKNKKTSDMNERFKIIKNANPNLVISIHMNSFSNESAHGAMTYYRKDDLSGQNCADIIQKSLNHYVSAPQSKSKIGDYFILNCNYYTSILIECGFISNSEEERKLNTQEYRDSLTDAIFSGILLYFGKGNIQV